MSGLDCINPCVLSNLSCIFISVNYMYSQRLSCIYNVILMLNVTHLVYCMCLTCKHSINTFLYDEHPFTALEGIKMSIHNNNSQKTKIIVK